MHLATDYDLALCNAYYALKREFKGECPVGAETSDEWFENSVEFWTREAEEGRGSV